MKRLSFYLSALVAGSVLYACQPAAPETAKPANSQDIPEAVTAKVRAMGFSTYNIQRVDDGYVVENDIFLGEKELDRGSQQQLMRIGGEEQYRTTQIVNNLPRTITVSVASNLADVYDAAVQEAVDRYNAENLSVRFKKVNSGGMIHFLASPANAQYLASAGFPSGGQPHNFVRINDTFLGDENNATRVAYIGSICAHEMGHCIGFRHTDYMDRSYSCGGAVANEGASTVGAVLIPGTPATADPNSWMLACIGNNVNRPFNANDRTALKALYP
ncbi:hypothetical protein FAES_4978 [Fibrella aestuarina BUZ 2]|uniref:Protease B n=1 Tax=Fibrella aestuarina BUZ 2 TaxID=1166018 RepID=I0KFS4_9BACT|nr:M57 family metalloprotease [Fibrella aestuarina]CCH02977.1 hypothetical protein FAES_4978 [Fibrella aestuarina BUZ 2]